MSVLKLYPPTVYSNHPTTFNDGVTAATETIHESFHTFSNDTTTLIQLLASQSAADRAEIYYCYQATYGKLLNEVVEEAIGSDMGMALKYLSQPIHHAEAHMLHDALNGVGSRDHLIYAVICGRDNQEILKLKETYFEIFHEDLGVRLASELSGDFERLIFWSLQGNEQSYDANVHSATKVEDDAEAFYKAGEGKFFGTDEESLFKVITTSPPQHLEEVDKIYIANHERTLISALQAETGGDVEKGATFAVGMKLKPFVTIAEYIHERCAGFGTDESGLTYSLIRYQGVLEEVNEAYKKLYGKWLAEEVKSEVGGKYETLLVTLIDAVVS